MTGISLKGGQRFATLLTVGTLGVAVMLSSLPAGAEPSRSLDQIVASFQEGAEQAQQRDTARLEALLEDRERLEAAVAEAEAEAQAAAERRENLDQRQQSQQQAIDEINQRRGSEGEDLEPLFDALRTATAEVESEMESGWLSIGPPVALPRLDEDSIVTSGDFEQFSAAAARLIARSAGVERLSLPVAGSDGEVREQSVVRLGGVGAFSGERLLRTPAPDQPLAVAEHTPAGAASALADEEGRLVFDPTDGDVLRALAQKPSLLERVAQGGVIGYITLALGALGLLIALLQLIRLLVMEARVRQQLKTLDQPTDNNPLGRVLSRFGRQRRYHEPEVLEARLDEMLLAEQPGLERGQSVVRVIAAIAPLMGLLGTVTGMIGTFQAITIFGSGDPKMMAGGISQALVTTVLGLVAAIPLLFASTALNTRSRRLMNVLERQASAHLADRLDEQHSELESDARRHASTHHGSAP